MVGIVTTLEGQPLPAGDIASRLGGFDDIEARKGQRPGHRCSELIEALLGTRTTVHNNYQDFQTFLDNGGHIGLQHDPAPLRRLRAEPVPRARREVPMLVVKQGQVAVVKAYVGLPTQDTSGAEFKFGSWCVPAIAASGRSRCGRASIAINPRCYQAEIVPTAILTLNWADAVSTAHNLDARPQADRGQEPRGLRVHHRSAGADSRARHEAPQRDLHGGHDGQSGQRGAPGGRGQPLPRQLQSMPAVRVHRDRARKCSTRPTTISRCNSREYQVETRGVYIQDVVLPPELVDVLTRGKSPTRKSRPTTPRRRRRTSGSISKRFAGGGYAVRARESPRSASISRRTRHPPVQAEADGKSYRLEKVGRASAVKTEAEGLAIAKGLEAQQLAIGKEQTMAVNIG